MTDLLSRTSLARLTVIASASFAFAASIDARTYAATPSIEWSQQFGSSKDDYGSDVAVDGSGNAFITGRTKGNLFGPTPVSENAFVAKYDSMGNRLWARQFGPGNEDGRAVATDAAGNVYVAGQTHGDFGGPNNGGSYDNFVIKYDTNGSVMWTKQWGTSNWDVIDSMSVDKMGNIFVSGQTMGNLAGTNAGKYDSFVSKLDVNGNIAWSNQFGTAADDVAQGISVDALGNSYVSGWTQGSLFASLSGTTDALLVKYDPTGHQLWSHQYGTTGSDLGEGLQVDQSGNSYVAGSTTGSLTGSNQGDYDAFLKKYDPDGNELWTKQVGTAGRDAGMGVALGNQNVYLVGATNANTATGDMLVSAFTNAGDPIWSSQFGSTASDAAYHIAADPSGHLYVSGATTGNFPGPNAGLVDALLVKMNPFPLAGDYNADGKVDAADYLVWRNNVGTAGPQGDGTGWDGTQFTGVPDGVVDVHDYDFWRANFGATDNVASGTTRSVPEPLNIHLLIFGILTMLGQIRNGRLDSGR